jgi:hypothetical protein
VSTNTWADVTFVVVLLLLVAAGLTFGIPKLRDKEVPKIGKRKREVPVLLAMAAVVLFPIGFGFRIAAETTRDPAKATISGVAYIIILLIVLPLVWLAVSKRFRPVVTGIVLAYGFVILLETFTLAYWLNGTSRNFGIPLSHFDAFYFALGTLTTGTGNVSAMTEASRRIQTTQMVIDLVFIGFIVALLMARYSSLFDRSKPEPPPGPTGENLVTQLVKELRAAAEKEQNANRKQDLHKGADLLETVHDAAVKAVKPAPDA